MDDAELDELLAARVRPTPPRVEAAVAELVRTARAEGTATVRPRRRRLAAAGVALGAVVVTAAGSLTAAQLGVPPFQTIPSGIQRIQPAIPVDYVTVEGKDVRCEAFLEYSHLTEDQVVAARGYVAQRDWSGFGQRAYDTARSVARSSAPDPVDRAFGEVLGEELVDVARSAVPGASVRDLEGSGPTVAGYALSCGTGQR